MHFAALAAVAAEDLLTTGAERFSLRLAQKHGGTERVFTKWGTLLGSLTKTFPPL